MPIGCLLFFALVLIATMISWGWLFWLFVIMAIAIHVSWIGILDSHNLYARKKIGLGDFCKKILLFLLIALIGIALPFVYIEYEEWNNRRIYNENQKVWEMECQERARHDSIAHADSLNAINIDTFDTNCNICTEKY